jgi:hypothetical protein
VRTALDWYIVLLLACIAGPYALGVRPKRRRDWIALTITIAFLTWLLAGFAFVRSA